MLQQKTMAGNILSNQDAGKGMIGLMTGLLGLYMTAAMWIEFNQALGFYFGAPMGVIIGTFVLLWYQDRKNIRELSHGRNYSTAESSIPVKGEDGRYRHVESNIEKGRNPIFFVAILYITIVIISEIAWANLIF